MRRWGRRWRGLPRADVLHGGRLPFRPLNDAQKSIRDHIFEYVLPAPRSQPPYFEFRNPGCLSQSKTKPATLLRGIAGSQGNVAKKFPSIGQFQPHFGSDRITIRAGADQIDLQPVISHAHVIVIKHRADLLADAWIVIHDDIECAVVIEICDAHSARITNVITSEGQGHIDKTAVTEISQEHIMFAAVPRVFTAEIVGKKLAGFVDFDIRDRGRDVG